MTEFFTVTNIIISFLVAILVIFLYIIRNLMVKVEKYEDITSDQFKSTAVLHYKPHTSRIKPTF